MHGKGATFENCIIDEENHRFLAADNGLGARSLKMLSDPYLVYKVSDTQFMKSDEAFANNKLAILCGEGNWAIATFDALNPQIADKVEVRMMPPLSKDGDLHEVGCCGTVVINANSKQKRIAWDLAKALHSEEALYTYAKTLGIAVENKNAMERFGKEDSRFNYAVKSMQYGVKANPHATLISQLATPILDMVQLGKLSSEEGIAQLNQQITQELEW
jgi:maltose-binding protein MalE